MAGPAVAARDRRRQVDLLMRDGPVTGDAIFEASVAVGRILVEVGSRVRQVDLELLEEGFVSELLLLRN